MWELQEITKMILTNNMKIFKKHLILNNKIIYKSKNNFKFKKDIMIIYKYLFII